jgi:co-chaperonin GroES (HSP10)
MASVSKWSNVAVAVQSAAGGTITITDITKASEGVVTATNTLSNGDYVILSVQGMYQLDGMVARVKAVSGSGFTLEGINTTSFDTFVSGTAVEATFGTTLSTATSISASGGDFSFIDVTTIHDNIKKQIPGLANPSTFSFENIWDVSDAGLIALKAASDTQAQKAILFTFANGQKVVFVGYVGATLLPTGSAQDIVKTNAVITMFGKPTVYAS